MPHALSPMPLTCLSQILANFDRTLKTPARAVSQSDTADVVAAQIQPRQRFQSVLDLLQTLNMPQIVLRNRPLPHVHR